VVVGSAATLAANHDWAAWLEWVRVRRAEFTELELQDSERRSGNRAADMQEVMVI